MAEAARLMCGRQLPRDHILSPLLQISVYAGLCAPYVYTASRLRGFVMPMPLKARNSSIPYVSCYAKQNDYQIHLW